MKIFDLALKDLTRSFRNVFAVLFMFGIPLLLTGMFYLMFGGMKDDSSSFSLPQTKVFVANLDEGGADFATASSQFPADANIQSMGDMVVYMLSQDDLANLVTLTLVDSAEAARAAVDAQEAGVAVVIPADFSAQFSSLEGQAVLEVYQDPTLTLGPAIVRSVLNQFMDGFSGARIAVNVAAASGASDPAFIGQVVEAYLTAAAQTRDPATLLEVRAPAAKEEVPLLQQIISGIMGGMMIFYAFYTGTATAETLLAEDEMGTLPRLFTTPTTQATILGGKLLAVLLTVATQVAVLLAAGRYVFGIQWGSLPSILLFAAGTVVTASAFGVFVTSFMKSTKQGGAIFGGVLTFSGMLGLLPVFTMGNATPTLETISLLMPQGWAAHGMFQALQGAPTASVALTALILLAWSVVFFTVGVWRFQKRYA